jgi:hypothetical protein
MSASVIDIDKSRVRRARHKVLWHRKHRMEAELLLCFVLEGIRELQDDLDHAMTALATARRRQRKQRRRAR